MGSYDGLEALDNANKRFLKRDLKYDGIKDYTLDIDGTGIFAVKESTKMTYKCFMHQMRNELPAQQAAGEFIVLKDAVVSKTGKRRAEKSWQSR
jgi:hypothetical protein